MRAFQKLYSWVWAQVTCPACGAKGPMYEHRGTETKMTEHLSHAEVKAYAKRRATLLWEDRP